MVAPLIGAAAAVCGALAGSLAHESTHALAALAVGGRVEGVGWRGGVLRGGPYIAWRSPDDETWRARVVGLSPAALGLLVAVLLVWRTPEGSGAFALGGFAASLLWSSPEDLSPERAKQTAEINH